jgi:hypothetical protein
MLKLWLSLVMILTWSTLSLAQLSPQQNKNLADALRDGKECSANLAATTSALVQCGNDLQNAPPPLWPGPTIIIAGVAVTASLTVGLVCLTHFMGACN